MGLFPREMMRLAIYAAVWLTSTFWESWHDWVTETKLRKDDCEVSAIKLWKNLDSLEKGMFVLGFCAIEYLCGLSALGVAIFFVWNCWARWLGHEAWMTYFSGRPFNPGTTADVDLYCRKLGLMGWRYKAAIVGPLALLSIWLIRSFAW